MNIHVTHWIGAILAMSALGCSQTGQTPASVAAPEIPAIRIFTPIDAIPTGLADDPSVARVGLVRLNRDVFDKLVAGKSKTLRARMRISLDLFGNERSSLTLIVDDVIVEDSGRMLITAYMPEGPGQALLTYDTQLEITVRQPEGDLMIRRWRDDVYLVTRLERQTRLDCATQGDRERVKAGPDPAGRALVLAPGQVRAVDVLVLYTPAVLENWVCGPSPDKRPCDEATKRSDLEHHLRQGIDEIGMHLTCSGVNMRIVAPAILEYEYAEKGQIEDDLDALTGSGWSKLKGLRQQYKADLITLIAWSRNLKGIAKLFSQISPNNLDALSIVDSKVAVSEFSLSHEIGHNMGAGHYPDDHTGAYQYAQGWYYKNNPQEHQVTIMGLTDVGGYHRINRFSNPDIRYAKSGEVIGLKDRADNARALRENREVVSELMNGNRGVAKIPCPQRDGT